MKSKNTIELNGNLYDAVSGKMLSTVSVAVAPAPRPTGGSNIDGFFRARTTAPAVPVAQKITVLAGPQPAPKPVHKAPRAIVNHAKAHQPQTSRRVVRSDITPPAKVHTSVQPKHHVTINHAKAHTPQSSVTLMRTAVKRPLPSLKQQVNVQTALTHNVPGLIEVKHAAAAIDTDRLVRAASVETSSMVAHHGKEAPQIATTIAPLHVQPVPVKPEGDVSPNAPSPQPDNKPQDIFDHALANAANFLDVKEHRHHFRKQSRRHVASTAAGVLALFVIAGFALYQNSPGMQLRVASIQAGVATTMPNFKAAGFAYNGVKASNGKLTVGFRGASGNYQLTQQTTSWSSKDMINDVSAIDASGKPNYTTVDAAGTTVYRFNNVSAMWVSGGKWYSVSGTGALSNQQVKSLVENV